MKSEVALSPDLRKVVVVYNERVREMFSAYLISSKSFLQLLFENYLLHKQGCLYTTIAVSNQ